MNAPAVKFKLAHASAQLPKYESAGAACFDLRAMVLRDTEGRPEVNDVHDVDGNGQLVVWPGCALHVRTGLIPEIPPGWAMMIYSRSGHGFRFGMRLVNGVGVIDSDYRGEILVGLQNDGGQTVPIMHGMAIAQAMLVPAPQVAIIKVDQVSDTTRGAGGFGSTDAKQT